MNFPTMDHAVSGKTAIMRPHILQISVATLTLGLGVGCTITTDDLGVSGTEDGVVPSDESTESSGSEDSDADTGPAATTWGPATSGSGGVSASGEDGAASSDSSGTGGPTGIVQCDVWIQDCPDGEKCVPYAEDNGDAINATRCSEILSSESRWDNVGDPCTMVDSPLSGIDTCGVGMMCFHGNSTAMEGTCLAFCTGSPEEPECDPGLECWTSNFGLVNLCAALQP